MMRTVLCYGDSNTHGTPPMPNFDPILRFDRSTRWPGVLAGLLGSDWHLIEEGLGGRTTVHDDPTEGVHRNGLTVLPAILRSHAQIDLFVMMLGTNDLKLAFGMTPFEIGRGVDKLLRVVAASDCGPGFGAPRMLLICPPPVLEAGCLAEMYTGAAAKSHRLAAEFEAVARAHGAGFLDAGPVVSSSPLDGVHWEAGEHAKFARAVAAIIAEML